jgi:phenylpyruvate tautomerase PptA (4-oxalocrotonate tautomerase family)
MSDVCVYICVDSVKDEDWTISGKDLMKRVRERIRFGRNRRGEV